jgi:death on curing protein
MSDIIWLELADAIMIHDDQIASFGGSHGVRDYGLLESALAKPKNLYLYGSNPTLPELAAYYMDGIVNNHPFIDGNKRVGFAVGATFLAMNGMLLNSDDIEAANIILDLASGKIDSAQLTDWLAGNI